MFLSWWLSVVGLAQNKTKHSKRAARRRLPRKFRSALTVEHLENRVVPTAGTADIFLNLQNATTQLNTITAARGSTVPVFIDFDSVATGTTGGLGGGTYYILYDPAVLSVSETPTSLGSDIKLGSLISSLHANYSIEAAAGETPGVVAVDLIHSGNTFLVGAPTGHLIEVDFHVVASTTQIGSGTLLDLQNDYADPTGFTRTTNQADKLAFSYKLSPMPTDYTAVSPANALSEGLVPLSGLTQTSATSPATFNPSDTDATDASIQIVATTSKLAPTALPDTYSTAPNTANFTTTMAVTGQAQGVLANDTPTANGPMTALLTVPGATATPVAATTTSNAAGVGITGASENGGVVTITTGTAYNLVPGTAVTIAGVGTPGYNGTYEITTVPDSTHFTYDTTTLGLASDPGSGSATIPATTIDSGKTAHGTVWLNAIDGSFVYSPTAGFTGTDTFTYEAVDATSNTAGANTTVTIFVGGVLNMPQNINKDSNNLPIAIGSQVVVPVNILNPNPINSGGLGNVTIGINYDPTVFDPNNFTINPGPLNAAAGWNPPTVNSSVAGQIVFTTGATGAGAPIISATGGPIALITFNVIGLPTSSNSTSVINLAAGNPQASQLDVLSSGTPVALPLAFAAVDNTNFNGAPGIDDGLVTFAGKQALSYSAAANPAVTSYSLHYNAGNGKLELVDSHTPTTVLASLTASNTGAVAITGHPGGSDTLTLDYTGGYFSLPGGISFNGGGAGTVNILGSAFAHVTDNPTGPGAGTLSLHPAAGSDTTVTYTGLTPITITSTATDVTVNLPAGTQDAVLKDSGTAGMETISATGNSFESFTFADPTGTLFVNGTPSAAEKLAVQVLNPSFDANLNINLEGGADEIDFTGSQTFAGTKTLSAAAPTINLSAALSVATITGTATTVNVSNAASVQVGVELAGSGGTVNVTPGSYTGGLNVNQNVTLAPGGLGTTGIVTQAGNVAFTNGSSTTLSLAINGPTLGMQDDQLAAGGTVNLNGANLALSGSYVPVAGDVFTLVSGSSVTGTFHNLLDQANVVVNGQNCTIHYGATSVTLTANAASPNGKADVFLNEGTPAAPLTTVTATRGSTVPVFIDFDSIAAGATGGIGGGTYYILYDPAVLSVSETATAVGSDIKLSTLLSGLSANYSLKPATGFAAGVVAITLSHTGTTFLNGSPSGHLLEVDFHVVTSTAQFGSGTLLDLQSNSTQQDDGGLPYTLSPAPTNYATTSTLNTLTQPGAKAPASFNPADADTTDASIQIVTASPSLQPTALPDTYSMAPNSASFSTAMTVTGQANGVLGNDTKTANGPMIALLTGTGVTTTPQAASINTITAASETGMVVTITTAAANNLLPGDAVTIAGVTTSGYNGTYDVATVLSSTQFTYNVDPTNPTKLGLPFNSGSGTPTATAAATTIYSAATANGTVWLNAADGTFAYSPAAGFTGTDTFTYEALDAVSNADSSNTTVTLYVGGVMSIPQGINKDTTNAPIGIGSQVVVPVNVMDPNPINSGGLGNVTIGINYDPTVFNPHSITVNEGSVNTTAGWTQLTANTNTAGQIVITTSLIGGGSAITATSGGSVALITFNVIGLPTSGAHTSIINLSGNSPQSSELDVIGAGNFAKLPFALTPVDNTNFNSGAPGVVDGTVQFPGTISANSTSLAVSAAVNGSSVTTVTYGTPVTLTAVVTDTSASAPPTLGSVDFRDGSIDLGNSTTPGTQSGNTTTFVLITTQSQLQVSTANSGVHMITATYTPGTGFLTSSLTIASGLKVAPAPLTITAAANTKVYDSTTTAAATPTVSGLVGTDHVTGLAEVYGSPNAGSSKTVSVSAYTVQDGNNGLDYTVTTAASTAGAITKAALTITATTNTKTYDSTTTAAAVPTVAGLIGNDTAAGLAEAYTGINAGSSKTLSVSGYSVNDGNGGNNYTVTTVANTTGAITKAALTITATANTKTYDSTTTAGATPTVSGLFGGDTVTGMAEVYGDRNAGSSKTLSVSAYTVHDGNAGNNYTVATASATTGTINQAALTITATTNTKTYDGSTTAAAVPTVSGLLGNDTATGLLEVYANINAGSGKTLQVIAYTVSDGNGGNNYAVTKAPATTGVINTATLTITATANTKTYDATTTAAATPTVSGLKGTDTVTGLAEVYGNASAGSNKTLSVSAYSVADGNGGNNYTVATVSSTAGVINQASLTIAATANTKAYDATTSAAALPTVAGLRGSDTVTGLAEVYANVNAGSSKTLSVSAYTVADGNGGNDYTVATVSSTAGVINQAALTITAVTNTRPFDGTVTAAAIPTVSGLQGSDTVTGLSESYSTAATGTGKTLNVNAGYVVSDGNSGNNYTVTTVANTTGSITSGSIGTSLGLQTSQASVTYGTPVTFTITVTAAAGVFAPTGTVSLTDNTSHSLGNATFQGSSGLVSTWTLTTGVKTLNVTNPNVHVITASYSGTNFQSNTITLTGGQTVLPKALTITATANTKAYDSTTSAAAKPTVSGLVGSDTVTGLTEVYSDRNVGSSKTLSVSAYTVNDGAGGNNYTVTKATTTAGVINAATLTITATTNTKAYDSTTTAGATPTVAGLFGGDTATGLTEVYSNLSVGTGKSLSVTAYTISDGNGGNNYAVTTVANTTGVITKAALTITATTNTKTYDGTTTAAAVPTVSGLVGGDTVTGLAEAYGNRNAGSGKSFSVTAYTINDGNGGGNYSVSLQSTVTGVINKAALTIAATTNTKTYDATTSAAAVPTVSGLVGGDTVTGLAEVYADVNVGTGKTLSVSAYTISDGNSGNNYNVATTTNTTGVILPPGTDVSIGTTQTSVMDPPEGSTATYGFTLHLAQALPQAVTANYSTYNGTGTSGARAGTDFKGVTNASVTIPAGATSVPINVTILGAAPQMPGGPTDKFFSVQLSWATTSGNKLQNIVSLSATGDIKEVFAPTLSIAASQIVHLAGGTYAVAIHVLGGYPSLAYAQADGTVSVGYSTANGTAKSGTNFKGTSGVLTIPASDLVSGSSTVTIPITAIGAATGQYFTMTLGNATNASMVPGSATGQVFIYNPQIAAGTPSGAPGGVVLTSASQLNPLIQAAEANWEATGVKASSFSNVQFQIGNIGNGVLANTAGRVITIDAGAAGFGWYTNPSNSAFQASAGSDAYFAQLGSAAAGHMDLLTVIEHELGHILGLDDVDGGNTVMATTLAAGVRRLP